MRSTIALVLAALAFPTNIKAEDVSNWAQFRGPGGLGIAPDATRLTTEFDKSKHMLWRRPLSPGLSSPCVWDDRIFLTAYADKQLQTLCISRASGDILWRKTAPAKTIERVHRISSPATPTPTTDGKRVFVYFGSYGLLCYDFDGNEKWSRPLPAPANMYGTAASPIIAGDTLIFSCDQKTGSYLEAINRETGRTVWKADRSAFKANWSTPMHWRSNGVDEIVIYGIWWLKAYDLKNGSERWSLPGLADEPAITPVFGDGLVYVTSYNMRTNPEVIGLSEFADLLEQYDQDKDGELTREEVRSNKSILSRFDADGEGDHPLPGFFRYLDVNRNGKITEKEWGKMIAFLNRFEHENALLAIRPGRAGKQTEVVWRHNTGVPECPSPLYYKGRVYMIKHGGIVSCLDAATGELKYQGRLGAGGPYYSSPVVGDGTIYACSARGVVTVLETGNRLNVLARNDLKERIMATPALVDGKIYVRTEEALYAFGVP